MRLKSGKVASVTIGGTVSPAGGNFEEPVTQATLKVVGAFHGLSRERSDARKYPAIHPIDSWSKYQGVVDRERVEQARAILKRSNEINQMMKVIGEEGTSDAGLYRLSEWRAAGRGVTSSRTPSTPSTPPAAPTASATSSTYCTMMLKQRFRLDRSKKETAPFLQPAPSGVPGLAQYRVPDAGVRGAGKTAQGLLSEQGAL